MPDDFYEQTPDANVAATEAVMNTIRTADMFFDQIGRLLRPLCVSAAGGLALPAKQAERQILNREIGAGLIGRGDLVPDGKVGSRMRFSVTHLDQFLQGGTLNPSVDTRPERSSTYADTNTKAEVCRARNQERWSRPIPGAGRLERRQNGPEKECTEDLQHDEGCCGVPGKARTGHKGREQTDTVLRLRRAMGLNQ